MSLDVYLADLDRLRQGRAESDQPVKVTVFRRYWGVPLLAGADRIRKLSDQYLRDLLQFGTRRCCCTPRCADRQPGGLRGAGSRRTGASVRSRCSGPGDRSARRRRALHADRTHEAPLVANAEAGEALTSGRVAVRQSGSTAWRTTATARGYRQGHEHVSICSTGGTDAEMTLEGRASRGSQAPSSSAAILLALSRRTAWGTWE